VSFYAEHRSFYRAAGGLCIHTWHTSQHSLDMEVSVSKGRKDIGKVEVRDSRHGQWREV
jgi:hypothetical protein